MDSHAEKSTVADAIVEAGHAGHGLAETTSIEEGLTDTEKQTKIVCLVGQCLLKAGCPCHRAVCELDCMYLYHNTLSS